MSAPAKKRRYWDPSEWKLVREQYPHVPTAEIAQQLGRTVLAIYQAADKLGLKKTPEFIAQHCRLRPGSRIGAAYRYPKGHPPANKGQRRPGFGPGRMKETQFKKGQRGSNWRPVGSQRLVDGYLYTKISDRRYVTWTHNWKPTHVLLWEKHRGPVAPGHALKFVNGDRADIRLDNLTLVSRAELCRRNSIHNLPPDLKDTIYQLGRLKRRINREKQDRRSA